MAALMLLKTISIFSYTMGRQKKKKKNADIAYFELHSLHQFCVLQGS